MATSAATVRMRSPASRRPTVEQLTTVIAPATSTARNQNTGSPSSTTDASRTHVASAAVVTSHRDQGVTALTTTHPMRAAMAKSHIGAPAMASVEHRGGARRERCRRRPGATDTPRAARSCRDQRRAPERERHVPAVVGDHVRRKVPACDQCHERRDQRCDRQAGAERHRRRASEPAPDRVDPRRRRGFRCEQDDRRHAEPHDPVDLAADQRGEHPRAEHGHADDGEWCVLSALGDRSDDRRGDRARQRRRPHQPVARRSDAGQRPRADARVGEHHEQRGEADRDGEGQGSACRTEEQPGDGTDRTDHRRRDTGQRREPDRREPERDDRRRLQRGDAPANATARRWRRARRLHRPACTPTTAD